MFESRRVVIDSVNLDRVAPAPDCAHLSADGVEHYLMQPVACERVKFGRIDLRSQPSNGRPVVGVESVRLETAAMLGCFVRATGAAGRRQRWNRSRARNDCDDEK